MQSLIARTWRSLMKTVDALVHATVSVGGSGGGAPDVAAMHVECFCAGCERERLEALRDRARLSALATLVRDIDRERSLGRPVDRNHFEAIEIVVRQARPERFRR